MSLFRVINPITNAFEHLETEALAIERIAEFKDMLLTRESLRFGINKEVVEGTNTTWVAANLDSDIEDAIYKVFNHTTGGYEDVNSLSAAKARMQQLKDEFFNNSLSSNYEVVESIDFQPTTGAVKGIMEPNIPLGVL